MRVYKMAQHTGSLIFFCVNYWTPHAQQPANRILRVFQFYVLRGRAWISKLCKLWRSQVELSHRYCSVISMVKLWPCTCTCNCTATGPQQDRHEIYWERHGSHAAPTCQEGKVRHSGPRTDEVLTVRDGWPRCTAVVASLKQNLTQKITRAASRLQTCTPVASRDWTK